jgi:hypothetical protein
MKWHILLAANTNAALAIKVMAFANNKLIDLMFMLDLLNFFYQGITKMMPCHNLSKLRV